MSDRQRTGDRQRDGRGLQQPRQRELLRRGVVRGGDTESSSLTDPAASARAAEPLAAGSATIPHTERFHHCLNALDKPPYAPVCPTCETRYAATDDGLRRVITCDHALADVDRDNIPSTESISH